MALGLGVVAACGGTPGPTAKSAPRRAAPPAERPLLQAARALPVLGPPFSSAEHFGRTARNELRLERPLWSAYSSGAPLPDGARVALLWRPEGAPPTEADAPWVLAMEKAAGSWRYQLERSDGAPGTTVELARCQRCHAEAPSDELFRIARGGP
jgi:hypothetical protein